MTESAPLVVSPDGRYYLCAACRAPIVRRDRCAACWRGWLLIEVDADGRVIDQPERSDDERSETPK